MILFVLEGKAEDRLFESLKSLFFPKTTEAFKCVYRSNIYSLYSKIKEYDVIGGIEEVDTVSVLNEILLQKGDETLKGINVADVSEIFLFFDYDFQDNRHTLKENNQHLKELLDYFDEETEHGRLYINYPMVESLRYTKELPDADFVNYSVSRDDCQDFKGLVGRFSFYKSWDDFLLSNNPNEKEEKKRQHFEMAKRNWLYLIDMNVTKANFLCHDKTEMPTKKSDIAQPIIFDAQLEKFVNTDMCAVSILNSFPIFLYEYLNVPVSPKLTSSPSSSTKSTHSPQKNNP